MNEEISKSEQELMPKDILDIIAPQHLDGTAEEIFHDGYPEWVIDAMEEYATYCSRTSEANGEVSPLNTHG